MTTTIEVRDVGLRAGLDGIGVCAADPFEDVEQDLARRVDEGRSAGMAFTFSQPERSTDIRRSFPWAQTLVVGARSYVPEAGTPTPGPDVGRIARFSTEDHYRPLATALGEVADHLRTAGWRAEIVIDDNRLVDRAAAVRAGVGWWGKNTMVLAPGFGPWALLGSVVTDAHLEPTPPMSRTCGTCEACLPACPTGALVQPGVLDARLCLAYWLQSPDWIPRELREAVADRFYGCDDCLEACPPGQRLLELAPRGRGTVDVVEVLGMADDELMAGFDRFYVPRRRAAFLRRNALVVAGNAGSPRAAGVVRDHLAHEDPMVRGHAAWAAGRLGGHDLEAALGEALEDEADERVRDEIAAALGSLELC